MPKWTLRKNETVEHVGDDEVTRYEATVDLNGDDPDDQITLAEIGELITNLVTERGIPTTAKLGASISAPLRWTDADLP